jgi:hypothetical protein
MSGIIACDNSEVLCLYARLRLALFGHYLLVGGQHLKSKTKPPTPGRVPSVGKTLYAAFLIVCMGAVFIQPAFAATVWDKASEIMKDVYNQILLISTIAAIVTASVALLMMNFSKSGKTVDESRAWLKRIVITWAILNGLGFIMSYITPFFTGGQWTP